MRGLRRKKLYSIYKELCKKQEYPESKGSFRFFKKLYMRGVLSHFLPTM